jgi:putative flavoprotein involved in K+ transport
VRGGFTVDFRKLAAEGMKLVGSTEGFQASKVIFANDLAENIAAGDASLFSLLDEADDYVRRNGLALPEEPEARRLLPDPDCLTNPLRELELNAAGVKTIIWATGFSSDYSWLQVDAFDQTGKPKHQRGVSSEPGIYFVGLPWQSRRGSAFIWGVWHDAKFIADRISTQRRYVEYHAERSQEIDQRRAGRAT